MVLRADRCELPDGRVLDPYFVIEEPEWGHVLALDEADRILLVRQYRYAGDVVGWELPGGRIDPGEDPIEGVRRELLEETGAVAEEWIQATCFFPNPARQTNRFHGFVARRARIVTTTKLDEAEEIEHRFATLDEVSELVRNGGFSQGNHLALLFLGLARIGLTLPGPWFPANAPGGERAAVAE
jgi:8-oxo-dGTP pyrophosphatase MutT (NUDIX family)